MALTTDFQPNQPLLLTRNVRYPSYQLWAIAGGSRNQENVLKIIVLHTMQWLRERFREHELPEELDFPPAGDYEKVDISQFKNVYIKYGYQLEIIWLSDEKVWSMQLTEPDLGSRPGQGGQGRHPVAGRIFETNISYQETGKGVLCGFQTMVSEPEGTLEPCEVYRLGVIKNLKRDPLVGLQQIWQLEEKPHMIRTSVEVKAFNKKVKNKDRTLPVVIVAEYALPNRELAVSEPIVSMPAILPTGLSSFKQGVLGNRYSDVEFRLLQNEKTYDSQKQGSKPVLPLNLDSITHYRMGYAHFFVVAMDILAEFNRVTGFGLSNGGAVFCQSYQTDERETVFKHDEVISENFVEMLDKMVQDYSSKKHFDFSFCCFVPQARIIHNEKMLKNIHTVTELKTYYADEMARDADKQSKQLAEIESERQLELRKLERKLNGEIDRRGVLESTNQQLQERLIMQNAKIEMQTNRIRALRCRPQKLSDVCDWAEQNFCDHIEISERARRMMKDTKNNEVDLWTLCDSLEYLANEYWDEMNGLIDEAERDLYCSKIYNRPFTVISNSDLSLRNYPDDYTIEYKKNGRTVNAQLTLHLKIGTDSERHLRVYFFYDKENRKIVIGSMPKHLRIATYS